MHAVLVGLLDTGDPTFSLEGFRPENPVSFCVEVTAIVGASEGIGAEWFYLTVTTPGWLAQEALTKGHLWGHAWLFLERWDYQRLWRLIADRCLHAEGEDWHAIMKKLTPFLQPADHY